MSKIQMSIWFAFENFGPDLTGLETGPDEWTTIIARGHVDKKFKSEMMKDISDTLSAWDWPECKKACRVITVTTEFHGSEYRRMESSIQVPRGIGREAEVTRNILRIVTQYESYEELSVIESRVYDVGYISVTDSKLPESLVRPPVNLTR